VIVGDGPLRPYVEAMLTANRLDGNVRLVGSVSDAERDAWLDRAHLFVLPSRVPPNGVGGEGFGIVFLEAAAHGLPVVAADDGGTRDAVVHGQTGLLVPPTDHVALADAITDLLLDETRAREMGEAGATRAREFAWPRIADQVEQLLRDVCDAPRD
jgi:phosphatidyl-myo-inositol dimannoside synthase